METINPYSKEELEILKKIALEKRSDQVPLIILMENVINELQGIRKALELMAETKN